MSPASGPKALQRAVKVARDRLDGVTSDEKLAEFIMGPAHDAG